MLSSNNLHMVQNNRVLYTYFSQPMIILLLENNLIRLMSRSLLKLVYVYVAMYTRSE